MSGSRHARTCGGPSIVAATRRNALRDTLPTCRRAALPHALDRDTCPAFISQSSTIVKAASPSIRRTRSPSAGAPPQAGPSRHADRGTRAAFCASLVSSPFPIAACAASISCPRMCSARCSATAAHRCCPSVVFRFRSGSHRLLPHRPRGRIAHGHAPRVSARVRRRREPSTSRVRTSRARLPKPPMRARPIVAVTADRILRGAHPNHTAGRSAGRAHRRRRCACVRAARARRAPAGRCDCRGSRRLAVHRQLFERRAASLRRRRERARHAARPRARRDRAAADPCGDRRGRARAGDLSRHAGAERLRRHAASAAARDHRLRRSPRAARRSARTAVRPGARRAVRAGWPAAAGRARRARSDGQFAARQGIAQARRGPSSKPVRPTGWSRPSACAARARSRSACSGIPNGATRSSRCRATSSRHSARRAARA